MAPFMLAASVFAVAHADEHSLLQMPVAAQPVEADQDECRCPGYYEDQCKAEAAQGCVWSSQGSSNEPWCQCLGDAHVDGVPAPVNPPEPVAPIAVGHCSSNAAITLAQSDSVGGANLAARPGAVPFGSSSMPGFCDNAGAGAGADFGGQGIHCFDNINDGLYGNKHSWIPGAAFNGKRFVGVSLDGIQTISSFSVARDNNHQGHEHVGRTEGSYEFQYTTAVNPTYDTPDSEWCSAGIFTRSTHLLMGFQLSEAVAASAVRIVVSDPHACIDELELY